MRRRAPVAGALAWGVGLALAGVIGWAMLQPGEWRPEDYACAEVGRRLTVQEMLERVRARIIAEHNTFGLEIPEVAALMAADPKCCGVTGGKGNPWQENWEKHPSLVQRLLFSPSLVAEMAFPVEGKPLEDHGLVAWVGPCGQVWNVTIGTVPRD